MANSAPADGAGTASTPGAGTAAEPVVVGALSPSRAGDFMTCPLLYRFRVIDKIPERPSPAAVRGTLVHAALERLFELDSGQRTPQAAAGFLAPESRRMAGEDPALAELLGGDSLAALLDEATALIERYFTMEDPRVLEPAHREWYAETVLPSGLKLRGYIDRLDVAPTGEVRVVDYKTGNAPREAFEARALFQMKFYALVLWHSTGTVPSLLQLMYLGSGEVLRYRPDEADLRGTQRKLDALWQAIARARSTGDWRPRRSRLCDWCDHKQRCPEFGGTPPPLPPEPGSAEPGAPVRGPHAPTSPESGRPGARPADAAGPGAG